MYISTFSLLLVLKIVNAINKIYIRFQKKYWLNKLEQFTLQRKETQNPTKPIATMGYKTFATIINLSGSPNTAKNSTGNDSVPMTSYSHMMGRFCELLAAVTSLTVPSLPVLPSLYRQCFVESQSTVFAFAS